jgi:hypothetical protein
LSLTVLKSQVLLWELVNRVKVKLTPVTSSGGP